MNTKTRYSRRRCTIFLLIMLMMVCVSQPACSTRPSKSSQVIRSLESPERDEPQEVVTINGNTYIIPPPWSGNKFVAPKLDYSDFRRIPTEYTHNSSKLYILAAAYQPVVVLLKAAEQDGIFLKVESVYRSAGYQKRIFKRMLAEGRTFGDIVRYVAPPGYSQHMLGTAIDFFPSNWRFADTTAYTWLQENGWRFGFEETYFRLNPMKMPWEAWHWNFIGNKNGDQVITTSLPGRAKKSEARLSE
ncbi:MAG: M15 family metallopeptidase [Proteobacteria bacterium]|nr:M15 family metallopeptidase [Pseudomonadota bacterium]MBU1420345.1 M15 family metallopeptidase [Pseudomonadota bacterium]MBU1454355.1 M15 family metallopeptidase [Pseudomonadota bacterium]